MLRPAMMPAQNKAASESILWESAMASGRYVYRFDIDNAHSLHIFHGSIVDVHADALTSSDDCFLSAGGGVSAALSAAGGPELYHERLAVVQAQRPKLGDVVRTSGGALPCRYIYHAVTIDVSKDSGVINESILRQLIQKLLAAATRDGVRSLGLPAIGTGVADFNIRRASEIMIDELLSRLVDSNVRNVVLALPSDDDRRLFQEELIRACAPRIAAMSLRRHQESLRPEPDEFPVRSVGVRAELIETPAPESATLIPRSGIQRQSGRYAAGQEPIPGYRLDKFLGKGGFGAVWKAQAPDGVATALKFVNLIGGPGRKEFAALNLVKTLRHTNLVPIFNSWLLDDRGNILSECDDEHSKLKNATELVFAMGIGDKSLADRLEQCRKQGASGIPIDELLDYLEGAARGIDFLNRATHDLGFGQVAIQHCDIKPLNLLIVNDTCQVCDVGLARVLGQEDDRVTALGGSPAYSAPEILLGKAAVESTDQYSLAISYVELRTGFLPFEEANSTLAGVINAHITGKLDLSRLSEPEAAIIRRATSLDPSERYPSCSTMMKALRRIFDPTAASSVRLSAKSLPVPSNASAATSWRASHPARRPAWDRKARTAESARDTCMPSKSGWSSSLEVRPRSRNRRLVVATAVIVTAVIGALLFSQFSTVIISTSLWLVALGVLIVVAALVVTTYRRRSRKVHPNANQTRVRSSGVADSVETSPATPELNPSPKAPADIRETMMTAGGEVGSRSTMTADAADSSTAELLEQASSASHESSIRNDATFDSESGEQFASLVDETRLATTSSSRPTLVAGLASLILKHADPAEVENELLQRPECQGFRGTVEQRLVEFLYLGERNLRAALGPALFRMKDLRAIAEELGEDCELARDPEQLIDLILRSLCFNLLEPPSGMTQYLEQLDRIILDTEARPSEDTFTVAALKAPRILESVLKDLIRLYAYHTLGDDYETELVKLGLVEKRRDAGGLRVTIGQARECLQRFEKLIAKQQNYRDRFARMGRKSVELLPARAVLGSNKEATDLAPVLTSFIQWRNRETHRDGDHEPLTYAGVRERLDHLRVFLLQCRNDGIYPEVLRYEGTFENRNGERFVHFLDERNVLRHVRTDESIDPRKHYYCFATNNPVHLFPVLVPKL